MSNWSALIETINPKTQCWLERKRFPVPDLQVFAAMLELDEIELHCCYELVSSDLRAIEEHYGVWFDDRSLPVQLCVDYGAEHYRYDEQASHTGRELLLMLAGTKPLAVFSEEHPLWPKNRESFIPEPLFQPYVDAGRFLKREAIGKLDGRFSIRRVLYALPDQAWRIDAYLMLWTLADKYGWNDGFEKAEGFLLGYETGIDSFHGPSTADIPPAPA